MHQAAQALTTPPARSGTAEPSLASIVAILWAVFAASVVVGVMMVPGLFDRQDPDSQLRLVQVRDLLAGQGWFDHLQHRMNPPDGASIHWSRLIDAPIAVLVLLGDAVSGTGEAVALAVWPLLMLLAFMAGIAYLATALGGPPAAVPALFLSLFFFTPLLEFMPGTIDHHNAQLAIMLAAIGSALRITNTPSAGALAGCAAALSLAIGIEMLPFLGLLCAVVAVRWAWTGEAWQGTALFGVAMPAFAALLLLVSAPRATWQLCDAISLSYVIPIAVGGLGLAALACAGHGLGAAGRLAGSAVVGLLALAALALVAPHCLSGPLGSVTPELDRLWLSTISEAQPLVPYFLKEPSSAIANATPPLLALVVSLWCARRDRSRAGLWLALAVFLAAPLALSFFQVRTLPLANALAIPALGTWVSQLWSGREIAERPRARRAIPAAMAFVAAIPLVHLGLAMAGEAVLSRATAGGVSAARGHYAPAAGTRHLADAERECFDQGSAALLAQVPDGLLLAPVFYGPAVLMLSGHSVLAGPYHRIGPAIIENIKTMNANPDTAQEVIQRRGIRYVALCTTSLEDALSRTEAPDGLLATLMDGEPVRWLEPVVPQAATKLQLWRVRE